MANPYDKVLEYKGYYSTIYTDPSLDGGWWTWVLFQRVRDFTDGKVSIPGMRHRVPATFESQEKAIAAAYDYSKSAIDAGETGV
jgi:hypothetical protein